MAQPVASSKEKKDIELWIVSDVDCGYYLEVDDGVARRKLQRKETHRVVDSFGCGYSEVGVAISSSKEKEDT